MDMGTGEQITPYALLPISRGMGQIRQRNHQFVNLRLLKMFLLVFCCLLMLAPRSAKHAGKERAHCWDTSLPGESFFRGNRDNLPVSDMHL